MNRLIKAKNDLQKVIEAKPTNQMLVEYLEHHLLELGEIIEDEKNFVKIDKRKHNDDSLDESEVKKVAAHACNIEPKDIKTKKRDAPIVVARWLTIKYFSIFGNYSRTQQAAIVGRHHSTACFALTEIENYDGWRKLAKDKFENRINAIHEAVGIAKYF